MWTAKPKCTGFKHATHHTWAYTTHQSSPHTHPHLCWLHAMPGCFVMRSRLTTPQSGQGQDSSHHKAAAGGVTLKLCAEATGQHVGRESLKRSHPTPPHLYTLQSRCNSQNNNTRFVTERGCTAPPANGIEHLIRSSSAVQRNTNLANNKTTRQRNRKRRRARHTP